MEGPSGSKAIDQLNTANFNKPVPLIGIQPGRFGIENDLPHHDYDGLSGIFMVLTLHNISWTWLRANSIP